ncbi:hypothetical protein C2845_PM05G02710 [Panicum miliaceum]|uniref:Ubiquitin-like protease family profile domain-containing protein n=1 Tax=Panicum miliaceum TaxID=4540 RepID=A0A3L6T380_PANMI|nr:hypothetical protein C2845_PM05G02710 [Panicum miliaceum]
MTKSEDFDQKSQEMKEMRSLHTKPHKMGRKGYAGKRKEWEEEDEKYATEGKENPWMQFPGRSRPYLRARSEKRTESRDISFSSPSVSTLAERVKVITVEASDGSFSADRHPEPQKEAALPDQAAKHPQPRKEAPPQIASHDQHPEKEKTAGTVASVWTKNNPKYKPGEPMLLEEDLHAAGPSSLALHNHYMCPQQQPGTNLCGFHVAFNIMTLICDEKTYKRSTDFTAPAISKDSYVMIQEMISSFIMSDVIPPEGRYYHSPLRKNWDPQGAAARGYRNGP